MNVEQASNYFKLIADPNRLTILKLLTTNLHMSASEFLKHVKCKQATLSHHLNELTDAGLLNSKKKGNKVFYSINANTYTQLVNFLNKIDRINKTTEEAKKVEPKKENPIRVVETPLVQEKRPTPVKVELPTYLL